MSRTLFLVRHGEAILRGSLDIDDHRWLTEAGRERFRRVARKFARGDGERVQRILTSPLPRAVMTAELLAAALRRFAGRRAPIEVCAALTSEAPAADALAQLRERCQRERVAAVGHEPMLGEIVRLLVPPEEAAQALGPSKGGKLPKGAIATIKLGRPGEASQLRRLLKPPRAAE